MIFVHTNTSNCPSIKDTNVSSSLSASICPWATFTDTSGHNLLIRSATSSSDFTLLCTKKTWPPRFTSKYMDSLITSSLNILRSVWIGCRLGGGVRMTERSLAAISENCKVRGMGVAVRVNVSTFTLIDRSFSLAATPNFCSSSMTSKPRSLNATSLPNNACVPMMISSLPSFNLASVSFFSLADLNRLI